MKSIVIFTGIEEGREKYQLFINGLLISKDKENCREESMDQASEAFAGVIAVHYQEAPGKYPMRIANGKTAYLEESGNLKIRDIQQLERDLMYSFAENLSTKLQEYIGESTPVLNLWGMRN